jgi:hypothetical protein
MPHFCGDEAKLKYKADASLIGEFAEIIIQRLDRKTITTNGFQEIKAADTEMLWPDLEVKNGHGYCGGRQVDFKGLNKQSYSNKFAKQNFTITAKNADQSVTSSNTEIIDELPAAGPDQKTIGIPMPTEWWKENTVPVGQANGTIIQMGTGVWVNTMPPDPHGTHWQTPAMNCGKFSIEHKDGVVVIKVSVSLVNPSNGKAAPSFVFNYFKKRVEEFWNSEANGYNQWRYHRTKCKRHKNNCNCAVIKDSKGKYVTSGCCKLPFQLVIEKGSGGANDNKVNLRYLNAEQTYQALKNKDGWGVYNAKSKLPVPVNTGNVYYPETRPNTYAHEVGHMMGFPDQYKNGVTAAGTMGPGGVVNGSGWPIDAASVMGANQTKAKEIHHGAEWFKNWIDSKIDTMEQIQK